MPEKKWAELGAELPWEVGPQGPGVGSLSPPPHALPVPGGMGCRKGTLRKDPWAVAGVESSLRVICCHKSCRTFQNTTTLGPQLPHGLPARGEGAKPVPRQTRPGFSPPSTLECPVWAQRASYKA